MVVSRHRGDSFPGMVAVGGLFFAEEAVRAESIHRVATSPEIHSNSLKSSSDGHESIQGREGASTPQNAAIRQLVEEFYVLFRLG